MARQAGFPSNFFKKKIRQMYSPTFPADPLEAGPEAALVVVAAVVVFEVVVVVASVTFSVHQVAHFCQFPPSSPPPPLFP